MGKRVMFVKPSRGYVFASPSDIARGARMLYNIGKEKEDMLTWVDDLSA